jgi:GGDEF domain-containing protein
MVPDLDDYFGARRDGSRRVGAVLVVEVDDFGDVADLHGRDVAAEVLEVVGNRLGAMPGITPMHVNGVRFVLTGETLPSRLDALALARRVQRQVSRHIVVAGREVALSASIGVRVSSGDRDPTQLVLDATLALDEAKRRGRAESVLFTNELKERDDGARSDT